MRKTQSIHLEIKSILNFIEKYEELVEFLELMFEEIIDDMKDQRYNFCVFKKIIIIDTLSNFKRLDIPVAKVLAIIDFLTVSYGQLKIVGIKNFTEIDSAIADLKNKLN